MCFAVVCYNTNLKTDSQTRAIVPEGSAQLGIEYACGHMFMYVEGSPVEI